MSSSSAPLPTPEGPGSVSGAPNLPEGFTDTFTSRYIDTGELRQHAVIGGDGPPLLLVHGWPENWYAWRLVMPAAGPGLRGHRGRPARHRADRQAPGRLRHRHPRRRPGRADGRARPRAVRCGRPRHRIYHQLRAGRGSPGPGRAPGRRRDPRAPGGEPLTAPVRTPRADQQQALAPRLQPGQRRDDRTARQGTRGHLLRLRVRHPGRPEEAARRGPAVLLRSLLRPRRPARQLRALSRVGHHPRTERGAQEPAAYDARPCDRRSGKLG